MGCCRTQYRRGLAVELPCDILEDLFVNHCTKNNNFFLAQESSSSLSAEWLVTWFRFHPMQQQQTPRDAENQTYTWRGFGNHHHFVLLYLWLSFHLFVFFYFLLSSTSLSFIWIFFQTDCKSARRWYWMQPVKRWLEMARVPSVEAWISVNMLIQTIVLRMVAFDIWCACKWKQHRHMRVRFKTNSAVTFAEHWPKIHHLLAQWRSDSLAWQSVGKRRAQSATMLGKLGGWFNGPMVHRAWAFQVWVLSMVIWCIKIWRLIIKWYQQEFLWHLLMISHECCMGWFPKLYCT